MRTEGALTPALPPGRRREDSRARGSPLPPAGWSRSPQDASPCLDHGKTPEFGNKRIGGERVGARDGLIPFSMIKPKLSALVFPLKMESFPREGRRSKALQRARGFHAPPGPRLQLPGSRRSPARGRRAPGSGGEERRALLHRSLKISSRRGASGWGVGPCWTCVMYHLQAHLIGR